MNDIVPSQSKYEINASCCLPNLRQYLRPTIERTTVQGNIPLDGTRSNVPALFQASQLSLPHFKFFSLLPIQIFHFFTSLIQKAYHIPIILVDAQSFYCSSWPL